MRISSAIAIFAASVFSSHAMATGPTLLDYARNPDGSLMLMPLIKADSYCSALGARMPTARELAEHLQTQGARGIRETAFPEVSHQDQRVQEEINLNRGKGFFPIYKSGVYPNDIFTYVDFYYSSFGLPQNPSDSGKYVWTASRSPWTQTNENYILEVYSGRLDIVGSIYSDTAVRCLK